jgi:low affinity Fe/Cu permease
MPDDSRFWLQQSGYDDAHALAMCAGRTRREPHSIAAKFGPLMRQHFDAFATSASRLAGSPWAFSLAAALVVAWLIGGLIVGFGDTYQLVINTSTTIITSLMVFLIQSTQNRNDEAVHVKLDELLRAIPEAKTALALQHLEEASEDVLRAAQAELERRARQ